MCDLDVFGRWYPLRQDWENGLNKKIATDHAAGWFRAIVPLRADEFQFDL